MPHALRVIDTSTAPPRLPRIVLNTQFIGLGFPLDATSRKDIPLPDRTCEEDNRGPSECPGAGRARTFLASPPPPSPLPHRLQKHDDR